MSLPTNPLNRKEAYLNAIATGNTVDMPAKPITREEAYLDAIAKNGGGSGGAENYAQLDGKPQINNVELESGNNSLSALGIASESAVNGIKDGQSINSFSAVESALANKVNVVDGKGLSTNDYDNTEKGKVADNASAIEAIADVYGTKNLLQNNGTSTTKNGVTFTVNSDGSVTVNGTASQTTWFNLSYQDFGPNNINTWDNPQGNGYIISNGGVDVGMQYEGNTKKTYIVVGNGVGFDNVTVYPMIRDARITDPTYVPYAMTNEQLTERVESIVGLQDQSVFAGDVNTLGSGIYRVNTSNSFNLPDTTTAAWIILSSFDDSFGVPFGIQLAFGYSPNSLYFRLNWDGWQGWKKVD